MMLSARYLFVASISSILLLTGCCSSVDPTPTPEPPKTITVYHFRIVDASVAPRFCGLLVEGWLDSARTQLTNLKVINLPPIFTRIPPYMDTYTGTFEVYGEVHPCYDGRIDPRPDGILELEYPHYASILTYQKAN